MNRAAVWAGWGAMCVLALGGCDRLRGATGGTGDAGSTAASATPTIATSAPTAATPAPSTTAGAADPFAMGSCELKQTKGGAATTQKTGGGIMNVGSKHWMPAALKASGAGKLAEVLLLNCGKAPLVSLVPSAKGTEQTIPMTPGTYGIKPSMSAGPTDFTPLVGGNPTKPGKLVLTAFSTAEVAGTFDFETTQDGTPVRFEGKFQFKCPQPGNGICTK